MKYFKEMLREKYNRSVFKFRGLWIFCGFFLLYIFLGLCLSYYEAYDTNMFFGADNYRAYDDLANIIGIFNHYRIAVHPLFLLLGQTMTLLVDGAVNRLTMSILLVEACCGALSVSLFDAILGRKKTEGRIRTIFALIYGFSFSSMIFSTVPETFIFACLGLVSYWYFLSVAAEAVGPLSRREWILLVFFGVVSCGVTLTNYIFYLVGLVYLLSQRYRSRVGVKVFCGLNALNVIATTAACIYQKFVWRQAPLFWTSVFNSIFSGANYEEVLYMNADFSLQKISEWLIQTVCAPLLPAGVYLHDPGQPYHPILFLKYSEPIMAVLLVFWILLAVCLLVWLVGLRRRLETNHGGYILALLAAYAGNLALHYIYGSTEAFMYSPHYLFYILLAVPLALEQSGCQGLKRIIVPSMVVFLSVEVVNNILRYVQTINLALSTIDSTLCLPHAVIGTVLCGGLLLLALYGWERLTRNWPATWGENLAEQRIYAAVRAYCILASAVSLFIAFNY